MAEQINNTDDGTRAEVKAYIAEKQKNAETAAAWGRRARVARLLSGASLLAAGLYAGGAAISFYFPSTGSSLINALPPTHVLTLAGHQQGASAKINWELAKAHGDYGYKVQLIVAANARKMLYVNANTNLRTK